VGIRNAYKEAKALTESDTWDRIFYIYEQLRDGISDPDTPTAINALERQQDSIFYDLSGRRTNGNARGVKISNGKKILVK